MNKIPVIILLGAPGAGKGTQAAVLSRQMSIPKISTGDMLRQAVHEDTELGRRVKGIMNDGKLVDDQTMLDLIVARIEKPDCRNGFILDGYPRNLEQVRQFESVCDPKWHLCAIDIEVSEEEIVKRIAGRRTCPGCQRIYNIYFQPPVGDERCDFDQSVLYTRDDDREEVVRRRLNTYRIETKPLVEHYNRMGILKVVNGIQPVEEVAKEISKTIQC